MFACARLRLALQVSDFPAPSQMRSANVPYSFFKKTTEESKSAAEATAEVQVEAEAQAEVALSAAATAKLVTLHYNKGMQTPQRRVMPMTPPATPARAVGNVAAPGSPLVSQRDCLGDFSSPCHFLLSATGRFPNLGRAALHGHTPRRFLPPPFFLWVFFCAFDP